MQIIVNLIAIASFILSASSWIHSVISRRIRLDFDVIDYRTYRHSCKIYCCLTNSSSLPIVINSVAILINGVPFDCFLQPLVARRLQGVCHYTASFPLNINAGEGLQKYIEYRYFPDDKPIQLTQGKTVAFQIRTNRGLLNKSVVLGPPAHYLRTQC